MTTLLLVLAALVLVFLAVVWLQPSTYHIARSCRIAAPAPAIFPHINDLQRAHAWAPWKQLDPTARYTFGGPSSGVGCTQAWEGNKRMGAGQQTIVESREPERVVVKLEFFRPFPAVCRSTYELAPAGTDTLVTWSIDGRNNFVARIFCLFMNQDKMLGSKFEEGLDALKSIVESRPT